MRSVIFLSVMNGTSWGGSEEQWYRLALYLAGKGAKVSVVVFDWPGKKNQVNQLEKSGCQVHLLPQKKGIALLHTFRLQNLLSNIPFETFDAAFINQGGWKDVVHGPFKKLFKRLPPFTLSFHNYQANAKINTSKKKLLVQWVQHAKYNLADAAKIFEVLDTSLQVTVPSQKVLVNPITFPIPQLAHSYPVTGTIQFVVLAALDVERKAQDILINTLASQKWKERNWQLKIYGEGKDRTLLQGLIESNDLNNKVTLEGYSKDVMSVLKNAHLLIQCTHIDAMPISVVEAMAMARPCVVSAVGDMPRWINDTNGFICPEVTGAMLDATLEKAWQQQDKWEEMGKNAFTHFLHSYPQPYEQHLADTLNLD